MRRCGVACAGALGLVLLLGGCAKQSADPAVISLEGRTVPRSELVFEYDRIHGADAWTKASADARRSFIETYAQKELLVRNAEKEYGPELTGREQLIFDRWYEKQVNSLFWKHWRDAIPIPPAVVDSLREVLKEQRYLRQAVCQDEGLAREISQKARAGADFEQTVRSYVERYPEKVVWADVKWVLRTRLADPIAVALFDTLQKPGEVSEPVKTVRYGWHVVELHDVRPAEETARAAEADMVAKRLIRGTAVMRHSEELKQKYGKRVFPEGLEPLMRHFAAMYDSIQVQNRGATVDFQALTPPVARFSPAERSLPLVEWKGGTMRVGEFLETLRKIDLDFWPTVGDTAKITSQVSRRIARLGHAEEAAAARTADDPAFQPDLRRKRQELYLDRYHRDHLAIYGERVTDADVEAFWQSHGEDYRSADLVGYHFLRFPPEDKDLAQRIHQNIMNGVEWPLATSEARRVDPNVISEGPVEPGESSQYPDVTALALKYDVQPDGQPTITEPLPLGSDWVILRITFRSHPQTLSFERARDFVKRDLQRLAMEDTLKTVVEGLKKSLHLKIDWKAVA